jgi:hypothetical protein
VPQDLEALLPGRSRVVFVRVHHIGQPAPEEDWLRRHATLLKQRKIRTAEVLYFIPKGGTRFTATAGASTRR